MDDNDNLPRPPVTTKSLWSPEHDFPLTKSSFDPSNIQSQNKRNQEAASAIVSRSSNPSSQTQSKEELYDIVMQPEMRPISGEQLVAEVKGSECLPNLTFHFLA